MEDIMDKRINRFKLCDLRFYPYLARVIVRLPEDVREMVLNDRSFQIITDDEVIDELVLRYEFGVPVRTLVYLNTKILKEPDHQIMHTIAFEIAHYFFKKQGVHALILERKLDSLLIEWGFGKEVEAVRYDQVVSQSEGYKIGYDWAKNQSLDYLRQHFGLYFDRWNDQGLGSLSSQEFNMLNRKCETDPVLKDILPSKKSGFLDSDIGEIPDQLSTRKTMLAGILTAVKEANLEKGDLKI
jgi:hypothetical protein